YCPAPPTTRALPSSPTRRSSDLQAVVDEDHRFPFQLGRRPAVAIRGFPPPELVELPRQGFPDLVLADTEPAQDALVENEDTATRSEEHTSELQSRVELVCRLLLA